MEKPSNTVQWPMWTGLTLTVLLMVIATLLSQARSRQAARTGLPVISPVPQDVVLTNQNGAPVRISDLRESIWIADIIFTRCAGPCPEMTRRMAALQAQMPANLPVKLVTLTTDPEFDQPAVLKRYGERFGADFNRWWFLTSDKPQLRRLAVDGLKLTSIEKGPAERTSDADLFIHSTIFVVVDKQGRLRGAFDSTESEFPQNIVSAVKSLNEEHASASPWADVILGLPVVNAGLNSLSSVFLLFGYVQIRRQNIRGHHKLMIAAFVTSALFLACYLTYHFGLAYFLQRGPTIFRDPAWFRPIYLGILLSHTLLAAVIVPLALITLYLGLRRRDNKHRRIARWTWPMWMYVSVTGVLIYLLLYQIFPQQPNIPPAIP